MTTVSEAFKAKVSSLGWSVFQDKIHLSPDASPANYVVFKKMTARNHATHNGGRVGLTRNRFRISVKATSPSQRETIVSSIKGLVGNKTDFNAVADTDIYVDGSEARDIFTAVFDLIIWYKE